MPIFVLLEQFEQLVCYAAGLTWLKDNEETNIYNMSGYTLLSKTRAHKIGGGVGLYISDRLKYKTRDDLIAVTEEWAVLKRGPHAPRTASRTA